MVLQLHAFFECALCRLEIFFGSDAVHPARNSVAARNGRSRGDVARSECRHGKRQHDSHCNDERRPHRLDFNLVSANFTCANRTWYLWSQLAEANFCRIFRRTKTHRRLATFFVDERSNLTTPSSALFFAPCPYPRRNRSPPRTGAHRPLQARNAPACHSETSPQPVPS